MRARRLEDIERIRDVAGRVKRYSDRLVGIGPFGIGIDGISSFVPGVGLAYSLGAGAILVLLAVRARAAPSTIAAMIAMLAADSALDAVPIPLVPGIADMLFTGHRWAADALLRHLDETVYYPGTRAEAEADHHFQADQAQRRTHGRRRRVVHLGEA